MTAERTAQKTEYVTAAAVAAAAMLPRWTPNRRGLSLAMMTGARMLVDETRDPGVHTLMSVKGTDLTPEAENLMNRTLSGVSGGTLVFLVSELARLVVRDSVVRGALVGGAYLLADRKYDDVVRRAMAARTEGAGVGATGTSALTDATSHGTDALDAEAEEHAEDPATLDI